MIELVLSTANPDKGVEIATILEGTGTVTLLPRPAGLGDVAETGTTLEDNARLKAAAVVQATGRPAVADDTGLEVEALGGAPGVYSARFAGEGATYADNVAKLLVALTPFAREDQRRAAFRTVALVAFPGGEELVAEGVVQGHIATAPRGTAGFGYDPVFVPDESGGRTFAEMTSKEKHACSHRGRAFLALATALRARMQEV